LKYEQKEGISKTQSYSNSVRRKESRCSSPKA
jgi:hypothetical protein